MQTEPQLAIPRTLQFALFATGFLWLMAARSAATHAAHAVAQLTGAGILEAALAEALFLPLLLAGFATISWIATRYGSLRLTNALPNRATSRQEWQTGAVLGWAAVLATLLPLMLFGKLHPQFWFTLRSVLLGLLALVTIALGTLALEVAFRGFLYRRLSAAVGQTAATIFLCAVYAVWVNWGTFQPNATHLFFPLSFLFGIVLSIAYQRTHALWFGWGFHFAWAAALGVFFGLPVNGLSGFITPIETATSGPAWLSGGPYGPEASLLTAGILLASIAALYRLTRDYAWNYTHAPIVAAGYAMDIAPPKAHTDMEAAAAAAPVPLVQILGTTSTSASTMPVIDQHLRSSTDNED